MVGRKTQIFRFADVEVREREFSLVKAGEVSPVEPKAFRVLLILLRNPQKLISKEELLNAVWGDAAVTENSLTRSIALLRRLLGEDTHKPRYIETVATVGYRWVCKVEVAEEASGVEEAPVAPVVPLSEGKKTVSRKRMWSLTLAGGGALALCLTGAVWYLHRPLPLPRITAYTQLTHDGREKILAGTDGIRLYFTRWLESIDQVGVTGGETAQIPVAVPGGASDLWDVSPDGSNFLIASVGPGQRIYPVWNVRVLGGSARRLGEFLSACFSPDGGSVAYSTPAGDIGLMRSDGTGAHKLAAVGSGAFQLAWSPDGLRIRFSKDGEIWEISSSGSNLRQLLPSWHTSGGKCCGRWTHDGEFYLFLSRASASERSQIWALDERRGPFRPPPVEPFQLTTGPIDWGPPISAKDGKKIYAQGNTRRGELVRFDSQTRQFQPYLGGISAEFVAFSKDGQFVAYVSYPEGILWRANRDGTGRTQLTEPPIYPMNPRWSPDGKEVLFMDISGPASAGYIVSAEGGRLQRFLPDDEGQEEDPTWSSDGGQIVFGSGPRIDAKSQHLSILDFASRKVTTIPGSNGMWSPRWSPDGRHISALSWNLPILRVFDTVTQQWSALPPKGSVDFPTWSRDSQSIFYLKTLNPDQGVYRIRIAGGEAERVAALKADWHMAGIVGFSMSLDPTDAPILLRDVGSNDIYALTLEEK
jgi:DNA-binding winged helix-turn-helix (wHTH) protein/Tol biopolymer transport system component